MKTSKIWLCPKTERPPSMSHFELPEKPTDLIPGNSTPPAFLVALIGLSLCLPHAVAGPYAPAAGQPGTTAIATTDPAIVGWAMKWRNYQVGVECSASWQTPEKALGLAEGNSTDIVCLGRDGQITLSFDGVIIDGAGPDFAVFENSFSDTFLDLAYVEVSSDGTNYFRFPSDSLTASSVGSFGSVDPTDIDGLAGKYRQGYGTPFDLADLPDAPSLDKSAIRFVRLVDVVGDGNDMDTSGDPIYDPYPTSGSAGFDLEAVAVLNGLPSPLWHTFRLPDLPVGGADVQFRSPQSDLLPDGRLLLAQGRYLSGAPSRFLVQAAWGLPRMTPVDGLNDFDPSFLAIRDATTGLIGTGGFDASSVHTLDPSDPGGTPYIDTATLKNYTGTYWSNPSTGTEGWLVIGTNGTGDKNSLSYISIDGSVNRVVVDEVSTYSSGLAVDEQGNAYVAAFEFGPPTEPVYQFSAAQLEEAITGSALGVSDGEFVHGFQSAGGLAVDAEGRLWAGGFALDGSLEVFDPATGGVALITPTFPPLDGAGSILLQPKTVSVDATGYITFRARDAYDWVPDHYFGYADSSQILVPNTLLTWQRHQFGNAVDDSEQESTLWGELADPDSDGIINLFEYAQGTDPMASTSGPGTITSATDSGSSHFQFRRDALNHDLDYIVEISGTLQENDWHEIARSSGGDAVTSTGLGTPHIEEIADGNFFQVIVAIPEPPSGFPGARFARLRIIR